MTLRRKLLVVFSGLAAIALIIAGLTLWITTRWDTTSKQLEAHYQRSLLLQQVRAATFQAVKEVSDAMFLADHDAPKKFRVVIAPAEEGLKQWAELADTEEERAEVEQVRAAFRQLVADTDRAFALIQQGDRTAAGALIEEQLERTDYPLFQRVTQSAVDRDRARRLVVRAATQNVQDTAHIILAIAGFGMLSLVLLLAAYLASDLFQPLKTIEQALVDLGRGDFKTQLSENREDEIGRINRAFNRMAEGVRQRERVAALTSLTTPAGAVDGDGDEGTFHDWRNTPSRVALHNLVTQLRGRLTSLQNEGIRADTADLSEALQETNDLLTAVTRLAEFSFPLDLNLARTDLRALIYDALLRFQDEISERSVSLEINLDPSVHQIIVDRLKLREVISEAIRNALAALPNQGGRLGVRTLVGDRKDYVALEIADNGRGMDAEAVSRLLDYNPFKVDGRPRIGLALTKSVTEQHGGQFDVTSRPGLGTVVRVELPVRL